MPAYLTPARFRTMRTGAVLTGVSDAELAELILDASAIADAYCNVAMTPAPHSFLGGTAIGEQHPWKYPMTVFDTGTRRVYPFHRPVQVVTSFILLVGSGATASIPVDQLVINHSEGWIEISSLGIANSSGLFGATGWIVPLGGLSHPVAVLDYSYGSLFPQIDERVYALDDAFTTYQAANGFWATVDDEPAVTIDDAPVDEGDFSYDREVGRIVLSSSATGDDQVRLTYTSRLNRDFASAVAYIVSALLGASRLNAKGMTGVQRMTVGEITIARGQAPAEAAAYLDTTVPAAALLLSGHKHYWMA